MPTVKACIWNIQNYGQSSPKYNGEGRFFMAFDNAMRNRFIARFCRKHAIDVLMIQEVSETGAGGSLADLQAKLNAVYPEGERDWAYSWCGSAILDDTVAQAVSKDSLGYRTGARTEGYAAVWRRSQATRFRMIAGLHDIATGTGPVSADVASPLNISQRGRPSGRTVISPSRTVFGSTGGYLAANVYPFGPNGFGGYALQGSWPRLNYPATAITDPNALRWSAARRPVYTVIRLTDPATTLVPIAAYHAPSNNQRAPWGAFMAGMARELYVINQVDGAYAPTANLVSMTKGVLGGDFNLSVDQNDWPNDYVYFVEPFRQDYTGGANCTAAPAPNLTDAQRRTTVQIVTGANHDQPITTGNTDDYLRYKIDLGFFRGAGVTTARIDLLNELINDGAAYEDCLKETEKFLEATEKAITNPFNFYPHRLSATGPEYRKPKVRRHLPTIYTWVPVISGAWGGTFTNWTETRRQYKAGAITDARRAAEYMHIFISDHLPLVVTLQW